MNDPILIALLVSLFVMLVPVLAFIFIKPDEGKFYCHEPGCGQSFDSINEIIDHLRKEHYYPPDWIDDVIQDYKKIRKRTNDKV